MQPPAPPASDDEAIAACRQALASAPHDAGLRGRLGLLLCRAGRLAEGLAELGHAVDARPTDRTVLLHFGHALRALGRFPDALTAYRRAVAASATPDGESLRHLASLLLETGDLAAAAPVFDAALAVDPHNPTLKAWIGQYLRAAGRHREAIAVYGQALAAAPANVGVLRGLGSSHRELGEYGPACAAFSRALELAPGLTAVRLLRFEVAQRLADWRHWAEDVARLRVAEPTPTEGADPYRTLGAVDDRRSQRRYADALAAREIAFVAPEARPGAARTRARAGGKRVRIGYLSGDLREHPVGRLIAGVLEAHDRRRFEVYAYALGPEATDAVRARIRAAVEHFVPWDAPGDAALAQRIGADGIDVLVDLIGYTDLRRPRVLAAHPAPVQVGWLGYAGGLGRGLLDYLVADDWVVPPGHAPDYAECILRLPHCCLPNDRSGPVGVAGTRSDYGLPDSALVLCALGQPHKITPPVFDVWMDALRARADAVLWLRAPAQGADNLRAAAAARGIAPGRIHFAGWQPTHEAHMARYRVADLALDTYPYGGHTTAADSLWEGCPLVALSGESFASRISGSVVRAAGAPELVTTTLAGYRERILALVADDTARCALRERLLAQRWTSPLFDAARFAADLEALLAAAHERAARGLAPAPMPG